MRPHTCPWWLAYTFDNPLRRLLHDPAALFRGLVKEGDTVVDIGCGLGHFSIGMARLVGASGKVIALDVQPEMVRRATGRAKRRGVRQRIDFRVAELERLGLSEPVDFVLAFWMVHEARNKGALLSEVRSALKPTGRFLIAEPRGHVSAQRFEATVEKARSAGFTVSQGPRVRLSHAVLCTPGPAGGPAG
jgi:ubiquinone/menaquinone biosynthesis C-methylase UbiE